MPHDPDGPIVPGALPHRSSWWALAFAALGGWSIWAPLGGAEGAILAWTFPSAGVPDAIILLGSVSYGATGAMVGLAVWIIGRLLHRRAPSFSTIAAWTFFLWFSGALGAGVTFRYMPRAFSPSTLVVAAAFLGLGVPLAWSVGRLLAKVGRRLSRVQVRAGSLALAALPLIGGGAPLVADALAPSNASTKHNIPSGATHGSDESTARTLPNILFILVDTLRSDRVGAYGYGGSTTPAVDSLAATGVVCERVIAASSWTRPTVATIFSGQYPSTHGLTNYFTGFADETVLMPEILRAMGYTTAVFSNNGHVSPIYGFAQGVDYINSTASSTYQFFCLGQVSYRVGVRLGFAPARLILGICRASERLLMPGAANDGTGADLNRYFVRWLDRREREPFFAYLHYFEPHSPYAPPDPWDAMYDARTIPGYPVSPPIDRDKYAPFDQGTPLPEPQRSYLNRRYDAEVRYQDSLISVALHEVRRRGLERNTLVIFTSDHGEEFFDHNHWGHGKALFHESTQVPLIVSFEGRLPAGARYDYLVEQVDLLPTILGLLGAPLDATFLEGENLAEQLAAAAAPLTAGEPMALEHPVPHPQKLAMSELTQNGFEALSLENQEYLYIRLDKRGQRRELLYDLVDDPACTRDVSNLEPELVAEFRTLLDKERAAVGGRGASVKPIMGEETLERLRALGYVN